MKPFYQQCSEDIDQICAPLKANFGVTSFVYVRNYCDGSEIRLTNQPEWQQHFYANGYYKQSLLDSHPDNFQTGFTLWRDLKNHDVILKAAFDFNIANGITLTVKEDDWVEFFFFGTQTDNERIIPLFINNMDLLERFVDYFKERAADLIAQAEQQKFCLEKPYELEIPAEETAFIFAKNAINKQDFLADMLDKRLVLGKNLVFTKRELDVVQCLLQGKTAKEAASYLFVSPRTVETHVQHIKDKLGVRTRSEMIGKLLEIGFN